MWNICLTNLTNDNKPKSQIKDSFFISSKHGFLDYIVVSDPATLCRYTYIIISIGPFVHSMSTLKYIHYDSNILQDSWEPFRDNYTVLPAWYFPL